MFGGHVQDAQAESLAEFGVIGRTAIGPEEHDARSGHDRGPDELIATGLGVLAIDEDQGRPDAHQGGPYPLVGAYKVRQVTREFYGCAEKRGGEWIGRYDEYSPAAHVVIRAYWARLKPVRIFACWRKTGTISSFGKSP